MKDILDFCFGASLKYNDYLYYSEINGVMEVLSEEEYYAWMHKEELNMLEFFNLI